MHLRAPLLLALAALAGGCASSHQKVLLIEIDGLRAEELANAKTPALDSFGARGVLQPGELGIREAQAPEAIESFGVLLRGAREEPDGPALPTVFERLKAHDARAETACFASVREPVLDRAHPAFDCYYVAADGASAEERDRAAVEAACEALSGSGRFGGADVSLCCVRLSALGGARLAAAGGAYPVAALEAADGLLGALLAPLETRPGRADERWLVLVTTDAGGRLEDGDPASREVFLAAAADGFLPGTLKLEGATLEDLAPTVLDWLEVPVPEGDLPGRSRLP